MGAAAWTMVSPRDDRLPVLPLGGRRSVVTAWPEGSFCSVCGTLGEEGYVGPVAGDRVIFPDRRLTLVCRPCALQMVGITADGFERHRCNPGCTDRLHLELVPPGATTGDGARDRAAAGGSGGAAPGEAGDGMGMPGDRFDLANEVARRFEGTPWAVVDVTEVGRGLAARLGMLADEAAWARATALWIEIGQPLAWPDMEPA